MKKRNVVFICIGALLLVLTVSIIVKIYKDNQKYNVSGDIRSIEITSSVDGPAFGGPIKTSDKDCIAILLNCIKKVKSNNDHRIKDIEQAPIFYEIEFFYDEEQSVIYKYTVYPATEYSNPFKEFYDLFSR